MAMLAWIAGLLGGLCMAMGIVTALEAVPTVHEEFTWYFWFVLSTILLLMSIAFAIGRGGGEGGGYGGYE